jgi:hypothetical protein
MYITVYIYKYTGSRISKAQLLLQDKDTRKELTHILKTEGDPKEQLNWLHF